MSTVRIPPERVGAALDALGPLLRRSMLQRYKADSCIAASRIGLDLLTALGVPAEAVRAEAAVFHPAFAARCRREGRLPANSEERERWLDESGGHSIGLGIPMPNGSPGLHVVLLVDGRYLWDLSIDQASRPERGMVIDTPVVAPIANERAFKRGIAHPSVTNADGTVITYAIARDRSEAWRQSNNWRKDGRDAPDRAALVALLLEGYSDALREHLATTL